jgi:mRNA interferase RelE/StbE
LRAVSVLAVGEYRISFKASAAKEVERLPASVASRAMNKIGALATQPRPSGVKKLQGTPERWRLRIGEWRVIYAIDDRNRSVEIIYIRHRSAAYQ